ncbi:MAG: ATP-grasp fold amidoligase family protein [Rikenellaceae bacterium]
MKRAINRINYGFKFLLTSSRSLCYRVNILLYGDAYLIKLAKKRFLKKVGRPLNWENPQSLNEILNYNKIKGDTSLWPTLADKHAVREYVKAKGLESILVEQFGVWESAKEIDFDTLPQSFILKPTNGCAKFMLVRDKSKLNIATTRDKLGSWLHNRFGFRSVEPHYLKIKPRIIAEKLLLAPSEDKLQADSLIDYKWYCFNGHVTYAFVASNRSQKAHSYKMAIYDTEWVEHYHLITKGNKEIGLVPKPTRLDEMLEICKTLSTGLPFARVDLYEVDGKVYFGEITLTPAAGYSVIQTEEFDHLMGEAYRKYNS